MNESTPTNIRQSSAVQRAFVITGITAYAIAGYFVAMWLAGLVLPDAADFYHRPGGSILTSRLHAFYALWGLGVFAAAVVGAVVGNGFYIAWQHR